MRKLVVGILAHVDAGKTTLSEALLYQSGAWAGWTTRTPFWTRTPWSGNGASPSSPNRRCFP